jgi:cell division protein FtsW
MAIGVQATVNIGVATACLPPKGTSLPFVSFGGSSLLASAIAVGILIDIASRQREEDELLGAVRLEGMLEEGRIS